MKKLIFALVLLILTSVPTVLNAQEKYLVVNPNFVIIQVDEKTAKFKGDFSEGSGLLSVMALTSYPIENLIMESNGGLMSEAIVLGKFLQVTDTKLIIEENSLCVSACAFAVMAAKELDLKGKLVFHTPYYPSISSEMSLYDLSKVSSLMTIELVHWFVENGYSFKFLKLMYDLTSNERHMVFSNIDDLTSFKSDDISFLP